MSQPEFGPYVLARDDALEEWNFGGDLLRLLVSAERSAGAITLLEGTVYGGGPPLHVHDDEDEFYVVLEGRLAYRVGDLSGEVEQGGVLWMPRQIPHTTANLSPDVCRFVAAAIPGGIEVMFRAQYRYLSSLPAGEAPDPAVMANLDGARKHAESSALPCHYPSSRTVGKSG